MPAQPEPDETSPDGQVRSDTLEDPTARAPGLRPPRQDRSRRSLERVLSVGAELLTEQGYEGLTIASVASRANVSVGLIYKRFENKAALFEAILLREQDRMVQEENEALEKSAAASRSMAELISRVVWALASITRREARLTQVFSGREAQDQRLIEHVKKGRTAARVFAKLLLDRRDEISHPDPERAVDMAFWLVNSALERRVHTPMWRHWTPDAEHDWPEFVDDLVYAIQAFLLAPPGAVTDAAFQ